MTAALGVLTEPADEAAAYRVLERARWGAGPVSCPHCGAAARCYLLRPADGVARRTRTGASTSRRVWKCRTCRRQFSVLTASVLHGSRISLRTWVAIMTAWAASGAVASERDLVARYRMSRDTAAHVVALLNALDSRGGVAEPFAGLFAPDAAEAARIRLLAARPRRPLGQSGPSATYG